MLQMSHEDSTYLTWGAPGCAVLPDGTFFVIAHTEFAATYSSAGEPQGRIPSGGGEEIPWYYGFQTWRLDADLNVLDYQLYDQLDHWSPLYVVPLEDYVVQVHLGDGYVGNPPSRTILFDCRDGGAAIMANLADESRPSLSPGTYSYLYNSHLYLREFGIVALATAFGVHLYRRGSLLGSATYEELGYGRFLSVIGMWPHPSDPTKFALVDWWSQETLKTFEVTVDPETGGLTGELLWAKSWAVVPDGYVNAITDPYADQIWGWVTDGYDVPKEPPPDQPWNDHDSFELWYLRDMDGGEGTVLWDRNFDFASNNNVTRVITPNVMVAAIEMYDNSATSYSPGVPNYAEEFWIAACVLDIGHGEPTADMIGLSRRDLVLGEGVPFMGSEDIDDVRNGSQYAPAYRDGTLLLASCPVYRAADGIDRFPVLVWKLEGAAHAEFGVANDLEEWLPLNDGIGPGRAKVYVGDAWHESVTVETFDQEWKPLKINVAEEGEEPIWRTVALLTPSLD